MNSVRILFAILIFAFPLGIHAAQPQTLPPGAPAATMQPAPGDTPQPAEKPITAYSLPPDLAHKAHLLGQIGFGGQLVGFFYSLVILLLCLKWRLAPRFRDWAEHSTSNEF